MLVAYASAPAARRRRLIFFAVAFSALLLAGESLRQNFSKSGQMSLAAAHCAPQISFTAVDAMLPDWLFPLRLQVAAWREDLPAVRRLVQARFRGVDHLGGDCAAETLNNPDIVLLDSREFDEYAVSRLPGAYWIDPHLEGEALAAELRDLTGGRPAVVYCSVGVRSAALIERAQSALPPAEAARLRNLDGGLFHWANAGGALETAAGEAPRVHGYNSAWGRLLAPSLRVQE